jgi:hypothetical protein
MASDEWWEKNTKVRNLPFISMFMKMSGETNFFYASMFFVQGHVEGEDMSFWSPKLCGRYNNYV